MKWLLWGFLLWAPSLAAFERESICVFVIRELNERLQAGIFSAEDLATVHSLFTSGQDTEKALQAAFDFYLRKRLESLDPEQREKVLQGYRRLDPKYVPVNSVHPFFKTEIKMTREEKLKMERSGALAFARFWQQAGQVEKIIQQVVVRDHLQMAIPKNTFQSMVLDIQYERMLGVVWAEWQALQAIPEKTREQVRNILEDNQDLPAYLRAELRLALATPEAEFIETQQRLRHLSFEEMKTFFKIKHSYTKAGAYILGAAELAITSTGSIAKYCREYHATVGIPGIEDFCGNGYFPGKRTADLLPTTPPRKYLLMP